MAEYDNTNTGALFDAANQKLIRSGDVDIGGSKERLSIVMTKTNTGKTIFEVYQKIGAIFTNDDKKSENSPDVGGKILYNGDEYQMSGWKRESKTGLPYTSISIQKRGEDRSSNAPEDDGGDLDDEIPF